MPISLELKISSQNQNLSLHLEKHLAILKLKQVDILESHTWIQSYVEKVIQNPTLHTALILIQNHSIDFLPFKKAHTLHSHEKWETWLDALNSLFQTMETATVSWIAGISGPCFGPSLQLALSCDYRIADTNTLFGFNEISSGLIPTGGACLRLPRLIGVQKALDVILKGEVLSAKSAESCGLIQSAVPPVDLEPCLREWAGKINKGLKPPKMRQRHKKLGFYGRVLEVPFFRQLFYYRTKRKILSSTKGFYPAPLKTLALIKKTYPVKSLKADLKEETSAFCALVVSTVAQNLISLHKNLQSIKQKTEKIALLSTNTPNLPRIKKTAVIGAGAMGGGITHWLAHNHIPVLLKDIHSPSLSNTLKYIYTALKAQTKKSFILKKPNKKNSPYTPNLLARFFNQTKNHNHGQNLPQWQNLSLETEPQMLFSKIRPQMDYSGFPSADLIIETVVEDKEIKKKVITESAQHTHETSLFVSNTSSFKISELATAHPDPNRFFGLHFFYPAKQSLLIEVVQGTANQSQTLNTICEWIWSMGKVPFVVQDSPGFLVQRLFLPLISEALYCLKEGANVPYIDHVYTSFGFRLGPFQLLDELGLDIFLKLIKSFQTAGRPISLPEEVLQINPGFLGKKNKKGFYTYNEKSKPISVNNQMLQDLRIKAGYKTISSILERGLYRMINESALLLQEKVVQTSAEVDLALVLGLGFPAFRGGLLKYANDISLKTVIATLYDWTHKYGDRFQAHSALLARQETGFYTDRV